MNKLKISKFCVKRRRLEKQVKNFAKAVCDTFTEPYSTGANEIIEDRVLVDKNCQENYNVPDLISWMTEEDKYASEIEKN